MGKLIDCDVHIRWKTFSEVADHLVEPWRTRFLNNRLVFPHNQFPNPLATYRRDAFPPAGGQPGSDPQYTLAELVERYQIDYAILMGESSHLMISNMPDPDAAAAMAAALNDWLIERWLAADRRFLGSMFVATQDATLAAQEIRRIGSHPQIVQVAVGSGQRMPFGQRHYYPIYEAAQQVHLPIAVHPFTEGAGIAPPPTPAGYPAHYIEFHTGIAGSMISHLVSLIAEGVFERFPELKFVFVEGGVSWLPGLLWRFDKNWKSLRFDTPWIRRLPSEYAREHIRLTTQPIEEPPDTRHLTQLFAMFPAEEMLLFSSDYPHWDFDNPRRALASLPDAMQQRIFYDNARLLYRL